MRLRRCSATLLGLLTLTATLAACGSDPGVATGDVVPARDDTQFADSGNESVVALPIGRLEISLGTPTRKLAADDTSQLEELTAPAGSAFVPITWQYDAKTFGDYAQYLDTDASPVIDLVASGASYRLPAPQTSGQGAESFYVLVTGDGQKPSLKVGYDGVVQTVDLTTGDHEAGPAAPLYDLGSPKDKLSPCGGPVDYGRKLVGNGTFSCTVGQPVRLPYAGDSWAPEGKSWLAVTVRTAQGSWNETTSDLASGGIYYPDKVEGKFGLGDIAPTKIIRPPAESNCPNKTDGICTVQWELLFLVPDKAPQELVIEQDYHLILTSNWGSTDSKDSLAMSVTTSTKLG
ncbi:hypothetical protein ACFQ3F_19235 [Nocardioides ginsengisoli]|uniref:Secreted protein n=1 Tax=Nocardioides ginsengisoli TaxID=363868 RepID=A0ABW3W421_9ACTN